MSKLGGWSVLLQVLVVCGLVHQLLQLLGPGQLHSEQPAFLVARFVDERWFGFYFFVCFCYLEGYIEFVLMKAHGRYYFFFHNKHFEKY